MAVSLLCNIRLGDTSTLTNRYLMSHALPEPDLAQYLDHSGRTSLSDGGQSLRGIKSVRLTWANLSQAQARKVREIAEYGTVYVTFNRAWALGGFGNDWVDGNGQGHIPQANAARGGTAGRLYDTITLVINNISIDNDPASF